MIGTIRAGRATFIFLFMLFKIAKKWSTSKNSITNLPPGPWTLPLIGNIHQIITSSMPHQCLKLGEVPYIVVTSPELAKEVMKTQDLNFCDRPNLLLPTIFTYNATDIAFSPYGDYWRQLRKICIVELLSLKRVESFRSIREEEVSKLVKSISTCEGSFVNFTENLFSMTYGITARAVFGKRTKHQLKFKTAMEEVVSLLGGFCIADLYPSIRILLQRVSKAKTRLEKLHRETDKILQDIINDHKSSHGDEDVVDLLLKFQHGNIDHLQNHLTDDNIKAVIQVSL
jgi:hypothetical protein